jgi:hypothetical protein
LLCGGRRPVSSAGSSTPKCSADTNDPLELPRRSPTKFRDKAPTSPGRSESITFAGHTLQHRVLFGRADWNEFPSTRAWQSPAPSSHPSGSARFALRHPKSPFSPRGNGPDARRTEPQICRRSVERLGLQRCQRLKSFRYQAPFRPISRRLRPTDR